MRNVTVFSFQSTVLSLITPLLVGAQVILPGLVTDRPDQTESALVVSPGWVQIETGVLWETDESGEGDVQTRVQTLRYPTTLVRIGLLDAVELRLTGQFERETTPSDGQDPRTPGFTGMGLGGKLRLTGPARAGWIPETAIIAHLELTSDGEGAGGGGWSPRLILAMGRDLSDRFELGWNLGGEWESGGSGGSILYTLALGVDLGRGRAGFAEVFGTAPEGSGAALQFDLGFTNLLTQHLQLDGSGGLALAGEAAHWFLSAGLSYRFSL
ncbi:MAG: transporter [Fidelibacterota bacterium]